MQSAMAHFSRLKGSSKKQQQVPPLRYAPVGVTNFLQMAKLLMGGMHFTNLGDGFPDVRARCGEQTLDARHLRLPRRMRRTWSDWFPIRRLCARGITIWR